jgi:uncharacterized heparinase superfamily protein
MCGFALFRFGRPILIDSGRCDYTTSEIGRYGKEAKAHNTIFINGLSPSANLPSWFQKDYKKVDVNTELLGSDDSIVFRISHNGFDRLVNLSVRHERSFILSSDSFLIEDSLLGDRQCHFNARFHFAPDLDITTEDGPCLNLESKCARFLADKKLNQKILEGQKHSNLGGLFFPEYGLVVESKTLDLDGHLTLPAILQNRLIFKD